MQRDYSEYMLGVEYKLDAQRAKRTSNAKRK